MEAHARHKDGSEVILLVSFSPLIDEDCKFQGALAMYTDITERKRAEQAVKATSEQLREYSEQLEDRVRERTMELVQLQRRMVENIEAERLWVSQELHDGPMQDIYGLMYKISMLKKVSNDQKMQAEIATLIDKLTQINIDLRSVTRELRPISLTPLGLEKAIREHSDRFDLEHPGLKISLHLMEDETLLPEHLRLSLFRIYQIALANVIRHAQASHIWINFSFDEENIILEIQDDGKGFVVPERLQMLAGQGHYGLAGAAYRAEAIGGELVVESSPGKGTRLRVIAPMIKVHAVPA